MDQRCSPVEHRRENADSTIFIKSLSPKSIKRYDTKKDSNYYNYNQKQRSRDASDTISYYPDDKRERARISKHERTFKVKDDFLHSTDINAESDETHYYEEAKREKERSHRSHHKSAIVGNMTPYYKDPVREKERLLRLRDLNESKKILKKHKYSSMSKSRSSSPNIAKYTSTTSSTTSRHRSSKSDIKYECSPTYRRTKSGSRHKYSRRERSSSSKEKYKSSSSSSALTQSKRHRSPEIQYKKSRQRRSESIDRHHRYHHSSSSSHAYTEISTHSHHQRRRSRSYSPVQYSKRISREKKDDDVKLPTAQIITVPVPVPDYAFHSYHPWHAAEALDPRLHFPTLLPPRFPPYPPPRMGMRYMPPPAQFYMGGPRIRPPGMLPKFGLRPPGRPPHFRYS